MVDWGKRIITADGRKIEVLHRLSNCPSTPVIGYAVNPDGTQQPLFWHEDGTCAQGIPENAVVNYVESREGWMLIARQQVHAAGVPVYAPSPIYETEEDLFACEPAHRIADSDVVKISWESA